MIIQRFGYFFIQSGEPLCFNERHLWFAGGKNGKMPPTEKLASTRFRQKGHQ